MKAPETKWEIDMRPKSSRRATLLETWLSVIEAINRENMRRRDQMRKWPLRRHRRFSLNFQKSRKSLSGKRRAQV